MRILISGICGFVGSRIAHFLAEQSQVTQICGFDSLTRRGSWSNLAGLRQAGMDVVHADCRLASDVSNLPSADWVIDAAATPSVLAGAGGPQGTTSRQLLETNLGGTINLLEYCKQRRAGMVLLSTSRVYSIAAIKRLPLLGRHNRFELDLQAQLPDGMTGQGMAESFPTTAPVSLYGATKLSSELLAEEYSLAFHFPLHINRCGVLAGAGQFGRPDQGIFAYWLHSWKQHAALRYLGFDGSGFQTRDCLHPTDLARLIWLQLTSSRTAWPTTVNVSGGMPSATSLRELSDWCDRRWGPHPVAVDTQERAYDVPWLVLDHSLATRTWGWEPEIERETILGEIAEHAEAHPNWLELSS